jgi:histidine decarboxylase
MPFLEKIGDIDFPVFDFQIPEVHSICMSGHKWIGAPWPCGIFMSKVKYQMRPVENPEYIGSPDTTFSGSRNGFSALILWDFISSNSVKRLTERIQRGEELAQYTLQKLDEVKEAHKGLELWVEYSPHALTVRFRQANDRIVFKYSLSNETLYVDDDEPVRAYSHIYLMDSVTKGLIDKLTDDLKAKDAFKSDEALNECKHIHGRGLGFK